LMVPQGRVQTVRLANGSGLTLSSWSPEVVQVLDTSPPESGIVRLFGQSQGDAMIVAESDQNVFGTMLEVRVRPRKTIKTGFFYVEDMPRLKAFTHRTDRNPGDEQGLVKAANAILLPRANIRLEVTTAQRLPITRNLGWIIRSSGDHVREPIRNDEW